MQFRGLNY